MEAKTLQANLKPIVFQLVCSVLPSKLESSSKKVLNLNFKLFHSPAIKNNLLRRRKSFVPPFPKQKRFLERKNSKIVVEKH